MTGGPPASSPRGRKKARIEIIPLIDVIFFLLATFVLFTLSRNQSGGLRVALPAATSGLPRDAHNTITLSVTADGAVAWNKEPLPLATFIARLQAWRQASPDTRVLINADENALFARVRYVFDQARRAGFSKVFLETRVRPGGP